MLQADTHIDTHTCVLFVTVCFTVPPTVPYKSRCMGRPCRTFVVVVVICVVFALSSAPLTRPLSVWLLCDRRHKLYEQQRGPTCCCSRRRRLMHAKQDTEIIYICKQPRFTALPCLPYLASSLKRLYGTPALISSSTCSNAILNWPDHTHTTTHLSYTYIYSIVGLLFSHKRTANANMFDNPARLPE